MENSNQEKLESDVLKLLAQQLQSTLDANKKLHCALEEEYRQTSVLRVELTKDQEHLRDTLEELQKIVRGGNGRESLIIKVIRLEDKYKALKESDKEDVKSRSKIMIAWIAVIGTIITATVSATTAILVQWLGG